MLIFIPMYTTYMYMYWLILLQKNFQELIEAS